MQLEVWLHIGLVSVAIVLLGLVAAIKIWQHRAQGQMSNSQVVGIVISVMHWILVPVWAVIYLIPHDYPVLKRWGLMVFLVLIAGALMTKYVTPWMCLMFPISMIAHMLAFALMSPRELRPRGFAITQERKQEVMNQLFFRGIVTTFTQRGFETSEGTVAFLRAKIG